MAEQLKVAREVAASCVGREMKVLVEREARPGDLQAAKVSSWEHGLIRRPPPDATRDRGPGGRGRFMDRAQPGGRAGH